eukprot:90183_1
MATQKLCRLEEEIDEVIMIDLKIMHKENGIRINTTQRNILRGITQPRDPKIFQIFMHTLDILHTFVQELDGKIKFLDNIDVKKEIITERSKAMIIAREKDLIRKKKREEKEEEEKENSDTELMNEYSLPEVLDLSTIDENDSDNTVPTFANKVLGSADLVAHIMYHYFSCCSEFYKFLFDYADVTGEIIYICSTFFDSFSVLIHNYVNRAYYYNYLKRFNGINGQKYLHFRVRHGFYLEYIGKLDQQRTHEPISRRNQWNNYLGLNMQGMKLVIDEIKEQSKGITLQEIAEYVAKK